jgi:hypothetical protein
MKAKIAAARCIALAAGVAMDVAQRSADADERDRAAAIAALLTPVAKAYGSDVGVEVANEAIQVYGGMGYVEETGAAQTLRDARIAPIYEGTNGIQAIDLITRKLTLGGGGAVADYIAGLKHVAAEVKGANEPVFGHMGEKLAEGVGALEEATRYMLGALAANRDAALAGATEYCRLFALASGGVYLAKGALAAARSAAHADAATARAALARHFAKHMLCDAVGLKNAAMSGHTVTAEAARLVFQQ